MKEVFPITTGFSTLEEALKSVNADFVAELVPVLQSVTLNETEAFEPIKGYGCIRRQDNLTPLAIMSNRYGITQFKDALSFVNDLAANQAKIVSAAATDDGARVHIALRSPNTIVFAPGDEIECFYTASTSHDGSGSIQLMCSPVHKQTQTMLTTLDSGVIKLRHTSRVRDRLARASGILTKMNSVWDVHADRIGKFTKITVTDDDVRTYFAMLVPSETETIHPRTQNVRNKLFDIYKTGIPSKLPSCNGTLLGGFVSALVYGDYYKTVRQSIVGRSEKDAMIESRLTGSSARFKADAFAACLKLAGF